MKNNKIFVAGHRGMVGSALIRNLEDKGYSNLLVATRDELDLCNQAQVYAFLEKHKPDYIFIAAAKVGGIHANNVYRAEFIYQNLMIQNNLVHAAWQHGIDRLMFLGSSCIYPKLCPQPILEDYLLTGPLEQTNEPYALAKIAGVKLCENYNRQYGTHYVSVMPTNLYGPNDNYHLHNSHVVPALIRKCHDAKKENRSEVVLWGTGRSRREFLYVDDMADACVKLMESEPQHPIYNLGCGEDLTIFDLATLIAEVVEFNGQLKFDSTKPDGTPQKLLNIDRVREFGWQPSTPLKEGLKKAYKDFLLRSEAICFVDHLS